MHEAALTVHRAHIFPFFHTRGDFALSYTNCTGTFNL